MKRIMKHMQKLHKSYKSGPVFAGTLCLVLALLVFVSVFCQADVFAAGSTKLENGPGASASSFWYGKAFPKNIEFWQELTVSSNQVLAGDNEKNFTYDGDARRAPRNTCHDTEVTITGMTDFTFSINSIHGVGKAYSNSFRYEDVYMDPNEWELYNQTYVDEYGENVWAGSRVAFEDAIGSYWNYSYFNYFTRSQTTYYRTVKKGETHVADVGQEFLNYYQNYISSRLSGTNNYAVIDGYQLDRYTVTNERDANYLIKDIIDAFMKSKGFEVYSTGTRIPLYQDGNIVERVEMFSFNPADLYFGATRRDSGSYNSSDVDVFLFTTHNYNFNYNPEPTILNPPQISTESGMNVAGALPKDDRIVLTAADNEDAGILQYYLSDFRLSASAQESVSWMTYSEPFETEHKGYLYVRHYGGDGEGIYISSSVREQELSTSSLDMASVQVTADPPSGKGIDVGTAITLDFSTDSGKLLYVQDSEERIELSRAVLGTDDRRALDALAGGNISLVKYNDKAYVKLNNIWYLCSCPDVEIYEKGVTQIVTDEKLRENNSSAVYVMYLEPGKDPGNCQFIRYSYDMANTTETPTASITTSEDTPAEIEMGSSIALGCVTPDSRIFYTTNGSAPVITVNGAELTGGEGTREYIKDQPIIVNSDFAEYGRTFTIMAQAVTYEESADGTSIYRVNKDSSVARFTYSISNLIPVEKVTSVPVTTAEAPTVVKVGEKIQLYSATEGVTIYYTLDGSEPVFNEDTGVTGDNTFKYDGLYGVQVPEAGNNTLLTITAVAYKDGLSSSELSRLIYQYPEAVAAPYAAPAQGVVTENTAVSLYTATKDALIYYEIAYGDDIPQDPTESSHVFDISNPFKITRKTTIKAYVVKEGMSSSIMTFTYTVSEKLASPKASVDSGTIVSDGTVVELSAAKGSTIHYTLDGSDPKDPDNKKVQIGDTVSISGNPGAMVMLRVYASMNGYSSSDVSTYSYSISSYEGGIYADKESGSTVKNGEVIRLNSDMSDADIYYTKDGTVPTEDSTRGSTVTINGAPGEKITIMAIALADGTDKATSFATFTYTIMDKLSAPTSSVPDGAVFTRESAIALSAETGKIYYTTDGTDPTTGSNYYRNGIVIDEAVTIKAIAVEDDYQQSDVSVFRYGFADQVQAPVATYSSGELEMGTEITFSSETEGASIYYRTDGSEPDASDKSNLYTGPITINKATNFKVIAVKEHMQDSRVLSVGYTVREPIVEEVETEEAEQAEINTGNRLQSRRSFSDSESGPSYTDVILRNATYGAVVSAEEGILPDEVILKVEQTQVTDHSQLMVKQMLSDTYGVVSSYDVTLLVNGEVVEPVGKIEIGLPIPAEYENSMIHIVHVGEDGMVEVYDTRRSNRVAYAKVDHLSVFSIAAPVEYHEAEKDTPWLLIVYGAAVLLAVTGVLLIYRARKNEREDEV